MATRRRKRLTREMILDAALDHAEQQGWEETRMHEVAAACNAGLDEIHAHFRDRNEIVDAWLDRADSAMLRLHDSGELEDASPRQRLYELITTWLDALAPHQRVTREMIGYRLLPGRLDLQIPAALRIGRTVRWIREAARLDAPLPRRGLEEKVLATLFINTFLFWLRDRSTDQVRTRAWLDRGLGLVEMSAQWVPGGRYSGHGPLVAEAGSRRQTERAAGAADEGDDASAGETDGGEHPASS